MAHALSSPQPPQLQPPQPAGRMGHMIPDQLSRALQGRPFGWGQRDVQLFSVLMWRDDCCFVL